MNPSSALTASGAPADTRDERQAIRSALKLLPGGSTLVVRVIEPMWPATPIVYLNRASSMFRAAVGGTALALETLAAVIHHEAAHLGGPTKPRPPLPSAGGSSSASRRAWCPCRTV